MTFKLVGQGACNDDAGLTPTRYWKQGAEGSNIRSWCQDQCTGLPLCAAFAYAQSGPLAGQCVLSGNALAPGNGDGGALAGWSSSPSNGGSNNITRASGDAGRVCYKKRVGQAFQEGRQQLSNAFHMRTRARDGNPPRSIPTLYINHMYFPPWNLLNLPEPAGFFNVVREPIARTISEYKYQFVYRSGWRKAEAESKQRQAQAKLRHQLLQFGIINETDVRVVGSRPLSIEDFVDLAHSRYGNNYGCAPSTIDPEKHPTYLLSSYPFMTNQITRFFCGIHVSCKNICSKAALSRAKWVAANVYQIIGLTEKFDLTVAVLQAVGPSWFKGLKATHARMQINGRGTEKQGVASRPLSNKTMEVLKAWNQQDIELYDFIKKRFYKTVSLLKGCTSNMDVSPARRRSP